MLTRGKVCLTFSKCSFIYHANMSPFMCRSKGRRLVINSFYHTYNSFILGPLPYNTMYSSWITTSNNCPFFMVLVWSYHWQSRYPFASVPLWEWVYTNPQYTLKYYCNYCFKEWNTCSKGGIPPFPSPHTMTSGYPYHQKHLPNLDGCCHC